jgi:prepilin-type N-terminal cleavage/methylation domain-containing protein
MKRAVHSRRGFTLPEILVTVAVISVLAAAVIPTVTGQLGKGDAGAIVGDVGSIRTAISNFSTDTRAYPLHMSDLDTAIVTTAATHNDSTLCNGLYTATQTSNWKGPYLPGHQGLGSSTAANDLVTSGFGLAVSDTLTVQSGQIAINLLTNPAHTALDSATTMKVKRALDGVDFTSTDGATGLVRFGSSGSTFTSGRVYVLLVPITSC